MPDLTSLMIFMTAALALLVTPGPAVLYIVARSLEQGKFAGFVSALGIALGGLAHVLFAALGLSALLMQSAIAFSAVKYLGAAYLIYLGLRTLLSKPEGGAVAEVEKASLLRIFFQGFVVNLFNPKTALFFLAFLPQFVRPERGPVAPQIIFLGLTFIALAIVSDGIYAYVAGTAGKLFARNAKVALSRKYISGCVYLILGAVTAFSGGNKNR